MSSTLNATNINLAQFLGDLPATTRERTSEIQTAVNAGRVYISLINRNGNDTFKLHFKPNPNATTITEKQLKATPEVARYLDENDTLATFSDKARDCINYLLRDDVDYNLIQTVEDALYENISYKLKKGQ